MELFRSAEGVDAAAVRPPVKASVVTELLCLAPKHPIGKGGVKQNKGQHDSHTVKDHRQARRGAGRVLRRQ